MSELTYLREENARLQAFIHILIDAVQNPRLPDNPFIVRVEDSYVCVYYYFNTICKVMELAANMDTIVIQKCNKHYDEYDHKGYIRDFLRDVTDIQVDDRYMYDLSIISVRGGIDFTTLSFYHRNGRGVGPQYFANIRSTEYNSTVPWIRTKIVLDLLKEICMLGILPVVIYE